MFKYAEYPTLLIVSDGYKNSLSIDGAAVQINI